MVSFTVDAQVGEPNLLSLAVVAGVSVTPTVVSSQRSSPCFRFRDKKAEKLKTTPENTALPAFWGRCAKLP
jgi:hypothetical protein